MSLTTVSAFARALDEDDFAAASRYISPDCVYDSPADRLVGPEAIMAAYAKNAEWARRTFDSLTFKSDVEMLSPSEAVITYTDITRHAGFDHTYRCRQRVSLTANGLICKIRHEEIPGQHEQLEAFFEKVGIVRE